MRRERGLPIRAAYDQMKLERSPVSQVIRHVP
jgi:hypothetical protein